MRELRHFFVRILIDFHDAPKEFCVSTLNAFVLHLRLYSFQPWIQTLDWISSNIVPSARKRGRIFQSSLDIVQVLLSPPYPGASYDRKWKIPLARMWGASAPTRKTSRLSCKEWFMVAFSSEIERLMEKNKSLHEVAFEWLCCSGGFHSLEEQCKRYKTVREFSLHQLTLRNETKPNSLLLVFQGESCLQIRAAHGHHIDVGLQW